MNRILEHVSTCIPQNSRILVAVSGGVDSIALLDIVYKLATRNDYTISIIHVDHALREESGKDAQFVERISQKYKLPFFIKRLESPPSSNIESWGRDERYNFFQEILKAENFDWITTAHTEDDVLETLLMKFFSNRELRLITACDPKRRLIRPLLAFSKLQLIEYSQKEGLSYVEDSTNTSDRYLRNRVRNKLIPCLVETFGCEIQSILKEQALKVSEDNEFFDFMVNQIINEDLPRTTSERLELLSKVKKMPFSEYSIIWRVIERVILAEVGFKIGYSASERVFEVINHKVVACNLPGGYRFSRSKGKFSLAKL